MALNSNEENAEYNSDNKSDENENSQGDKLFKDVSNFTNYDDLFVLDDEDIED